MLDAIVRLCLWVLNVSFLIGIACAILYIACILVFICEVLLLLCAENDWHRKKRKRACFRN